MERLTKKLSDGTYMFINAEAAKKATTKLGEYEDREEKENKEENTERNN